MPDKEIIIELQSGEKVTITDPTGLRKTLEIHIGDALLNGSNDQVWLKCNGSNNAEYLRKLPVEPMSIGTALFFSKDELANTLQSGEFYIG
ncbi:MAG: hypothetical protein GY866_19695 [Proteobacteria bacterium]|nr:hypothetical protein [Pseudomonadota bacterium]